MIKYKRAYQIYKKRYIDTNKSKKEAYVFLCMLGDKYIPGVLVVVASTRQFDNSRDFVCMVTNDVSKIAQKILKKNKIIVKKVNFIEKNTKHFSNTDRYSWLNKSYTKWNALALVEYDKVLFMDADLLVMKDIDPLFKLAHPGGAFESPYSRRFKKNSRIKNYYGETKTGDIIPKKTIKYALNNYGNSYDGSLVLLKPSMKSFNKLINYLNSQDIISCNCPVGGDEIVLVEIFNDWTNIGYEYLYAMDRHPKINNPKIYNYIGGDKKPWQYKSDDPEMKWDDIIEWWKVGSKINIKKIIKILDKKSD